jgi:sterol desaturase/sphingolipid hydroxylase (fatty acid hydroxylase superfamily)
MDILASLSDATGWFTGSKRMLIAFFLVALGYFIFKMRHEFSQHAIQNTAATIVVYGINVVATVLFSRDINTFAQAAYDRLGIPTIAPDFWDGVPLWIGLIVVIFAVDFCDYLIHRLMHTRVLWPSHAAHHSDTFVNAFSTFRIHFFEGVLMSLTYLVVLTWMQLPDLIPVVAFLLISLNMYVHMDLDWGHGPFKYLIASPRFHRWHHADTPAAHGKNLANVIPLYDVIFGTYYVPGPCNEPMGALASGIEDKNPIKIWLYPFQAWAIMIGEAFGKLSAATRRQAADDLHRNDLPPAE